MTEKLKLCFVLAMAATLMGTARARVEIDRTGSFQITYSSSIGSNENGERVFDGTTETKWLTAGGDTTGWIQFDYSDEDAFVVDGYTLTSANDAPDRTPKNWALQGSNNGSSWTTVDTQTDQTGWATFEERTYSFTNTTAYKMYRLNVTANNGSGNLMGFSEMQLLSGDVDTTDMPGTISSSTQIGIRESAYAAFDGTSQTKWLTASGNSTGWIQFQFADGAAYAVNGYAITSANDRSDRDPVDWTLKGSNDGVNWTDLDSRAGEFWTDRFQRRMFEFNNSTTYAYYQLNVTKNNGDSLMGFSELELIEIQDDPAITSMTPGNFSATAADPLVLVWDSVRTSGSETYTVHFGTDPNFIGADSIEVSGITEKQWTVPEASLTDDTAYYWQVDIVDNPYGVGMDTFEGSPEKFRLLREAQKVLEWTMDSFGDGTVYDYERPIVDVTATASSQEQGTRSPDRTVGSWGLTVDPTIYDPNGLGHSNNAADMWISNPNQEGTVWIQYAFDQAYAIGLMHVWNHNVGEPYTAELDRGMRDVIVSYSQDGEVWTILGNYTIPQGTGLAGMAPNTKINFGGITAQYVRITAAASNSNWGATGNFHALSEVRFGHYNQQAVSYVMPDMSGSGNDGLTYVDPVLSTEAISVKSIDLNGNDMVYMEHTDPNLAETLPLGADEDCYASWSMNFYAMLPERSPNLSFFVGFGDFEKGTGRYIAQFAEGIHFWGGANIDGVTNVDFDLNRWQMITVTYDSETLCIYKNAHEIFNEPVDLGVAIPKVSVSGSTPWGSSALVALIDEFCVYKGVLTQADIDQLKDAMPTQYEALNPVPADEASNVEIDPVLSWDAPRDAIDPTYSIYFGTDPEAMTLIASDLTETTFDAMGLGLDYGVTYYWQVDTSTGDPSAVWSFTTMPLSAMPQLALGWDFENLVTYQHTFEQAIENVTATASSYEDPTATGRMPGRAANGIGLTVVPQIADANALQHSNNATYMWISQPDDPNTQWIKFGFDQAYELGTMHVWNHNVGAPYTEELNRGMRDVVVRYTLTDSTDPNDWTVLGDYTIPMGTGENGMAPNIAIDFGGVDAQYVMIEGAKTNSNWGAARNFHALSEVRFGIYGTIATSQAVEDISGNGNEGIICETPEFVEGIGGGTSVKIDSSDIYLLGDHIDAWIEDAATLPFGAGDSWSMNIYVYLPSNPPSPTLFAGFGGTDQGTGRFVGRFGGVHFWGGNNVDVASGDQYRYGHWQMVTVTYSGTEMKLYLNGEEVASGTPSFLDAVEYITVGGWNPWGNRLNGRADNFMLYRGVLSRNDIAGLAAALPLEGDLDWNGTVDVLDLPEFFGNWLTLDDCTNPADLNEDCNVDLDDFAVIAGNWLAVQ